MKSSSRLVPISPATTAGRFPSRLHLMFEFQGSKVKNNIVRNNDLDHFSSMRFLCQSVPFLSPTRTYIGDFADPREGGRLHCELRQEKMFALNFQTSISFVKKRFAIGLEKMLRFSSFYVVLKNPIENLKTRPSGFFNGLQNPMTKKKVHKTN